jgi:hypothetical protein
MNAAPVPPALNASSEAWANYYMLLNQWLQTQYQVQPYSPPPYDLVPREDNPTAALSQPKLPGPSLKFFGTIK